MTYYGGKEMAEAFRTVRRNTIQIAEDIPDDKYGYQATPDMQTVAQELAHVAAATWWHPKAHCSRQEDVHLLRRLRHYMGKSAEIEKGLTTKSQILEALRKGGDDFAQFLDALTPEQLAETVSFPPPVQPSSRTRFEMLLGVKEHEMHHRAKLMVIERLLGIVPHLTRIRTAADVGGGGSGAVRAVAGKTPMWTLVTSYKFKVECGVKAVRQQAPQFVTCNFPRFPPST